MYALEKLAQDKRVTVRRGGEANAEGPAVVYGVRQVQRVMDNPALECAIRRRVIEAAGSFQVSNHVS